MAQFDIARLYGGRSSVEFASDDPDNPIVAWFHHPRPEELHHALHSAKLELDGEGSIRVKDGTDKATLVAVADYQHKLGCLCVEGFDNLDVWAEFDGPKRKKESSGLEAIVPELASLIHPVVFRKIGEAADKAATLSAEEKKG